MNRTTQSPSFRRFAIGTLACALFGAAGGAFAAEKAFTCTPVDVGVFPATRVHVQCSPADGNIHWFALKDTDSGDANRVLSVLSTALAAKKKLTIWYDPADLSGGAFGCQTGDCRVIRGVVMF